MIDSTRLAEIREDCAEANTPYRSSAVVPILEILELVTAYEAARELVESSRSGSMDEIHTAMHSLENLFPEPTK